MSEAAGRLRLFPLFTVLFPGMRVPLQVFEHRYRVLIAECISEPAPFGIALIREGPEVGGTAVPYEVGTTAVIESVTPAGPDRLRVDVRGERRFRIRTLHHDRPYLSAEVEYPPDEVGQVDEDLLQETLTGAAQLDRLRQMIESRYRRSVGLPGSPAALADAVAVWATPVAPAEQLQAVLEAFEVPRRLELAYALLDDLLAATHRQAQEAVARRWGSVERRN